MRVSSTSTNSLFSSLRLQVANLQRELGDAQKEATTGRAADTGLALGHGTGRRVSLMNDVERLTTITETNQIAKQRLEMSLSATTSLNQLGDDLLSVLSVNVGSSTTSGITAEAGRSALAAITGIMNTSFNGEALFGGINSTQSPISDFTDGGGKAALDAAFLGHFGFTQSDPAAGSITGADMTTFLDTVMSPIIEGSGWNTHISTASDDEITARIGLSETTSASVSANEEPFRKLMFAAIVASEFFDSGLGEEAQSAAAKKALELVGSSSSGIANLQGEIGFKANRIKQATDRLSVQIDELTLHSDKLVEVDPYEAATRLNSLVTQIETSYTLTGRIQQLSLLNYLR